MDLVREILLKIEADPEFDGNKMRGISGAALGITDHTDPEIFYNAVHLVEEGYLEGNVKMSHAEKTKAKAKGAASVGMGLLFEIAKAEIKKKLGLS
jgi:hypothetical protein